MCADIIKSNICIYRQ